MELYRKKIKIQNKTNKNMKDVNNKTQDYPIQNIYIQKIINQAQPINDTTKAGSTGENFHNIRQNMEILFSNEENKQKAIKFAIEIGKRKNVRKISNDDFQKSASPIPQRRGPYISGNVDGFQVTPNRTNIEIQGYNDRNSNKSILVNDNSYYCQNPNNTVYNFYNINQRNLNNNIKTIENRNPMNNYKKEIEIDYFYEKQQNPKIINPEESQNEFELSTIKNTDNRSI